MLIFNFGGSRNGIWIAGDCALDFPLLFESETLVSGSTSTELGRSVFWEDCCAASGGGTLSWLADWRIGRGDGGLLVVGVVAAAVPLVAFSFFCFFFLPWIGAISGSGSGSTEEVQLSFLVPLPFAPVASFAYFSL